MFLDSLTVAAPFVGGAVGSFVAFGLSWFRERRRSEDQYRAPQREAIAAMVAGNHDLQLATLNWRRAFADLTAAEREHAADVTVQIAADMREAERAYGVALLNLRRAIDIAALTVVDAQCWEAVVAVAAAFASLAQVMPADASVKTADESDELNARLAAEALRLGGATAALVRTANARVAPTTTRGNRRRRRQAQQRLSERAQVAADAQPPYTE
jgi:hypothetical protein